MSSKQNLGWMVTAFAALGGAMGVVACGSVSNDPIDAGSADARIDGGDDDDDDIPDAGIDASEHRENRVFHTVPTETSTLLYKTDLVDGVPGETTLVSTPTANAKTNISSVQSSADGKTIAYIADALTDEKLELFVQKLGAGGPSAPARASLATAPGGNAIGQFFLTRDGHAALYSWGSSSQFGFFGTQYYFVNLSGATPGTPVALAGGTGIGSAALSEDGDKFVFVDAGALYVVDTSAAAPSVAQKISTGTTGNVQSVVLSPDGKRVAYISDNQTADVYELFVADLSAAIPGAPQKASGALVPNGDVVFGYLGSPLHAFSRDSKRLAYLADATTNDVNELFVVDVSGASPAPARKVNDALVSGGAVGDGSFGIFLLSPFKFSPDSKRIAYLADQRVNDVVELFVSDVSGSLPTVPARVSGTLVASGDVLALAFAGDGSGLAYVADQLTNEVSEVFYVNLRNAVPTAAVRVNSDFVAGGGLSAIGLGFSVNLSNDGRRLAFVAAGDVVNRSEIYISDVSSGVPGEAVSVQVPTNATSTVFFQGFSKDGSELVYVANTVASTYDVWGLDVSGATPAAPVKLNNVSAFGGVVPNFLIVP